ncbi:MAG: ASCH domain-containing protein [Candidatus Nezhaarchaeota archaeon]|nr:ASCH domain-containing protein [Candidatus Nezhaarchaeota archaeon]MCX8141633.1 ASCH domain-containing protein [Candidatus Nezhaarchaeota archaeon]MDW8049900.1 ASCH domain-containing protein [Nitrososphaerota archaeon]
MKRLNFSRRYKGKIKKGVKKQTIRLSTNLKEGDEVQIVAGKEVLGIAKIVKVERKMFEELTDEDARKDGFENLNQLMKALKRHYGKLSGKKKVCIISFEVQQNEETS